MKPYPMRRRYVRSIIFNILFLMLSAFLSIAYIPFLLLPHKGFVYLIRFYLLCTYVLERAVLGLRYELRGQKHLFDAPPYIIGAKHQSAYETLKLHLIFNDPAIILKRELLKIPLWGIFLKKSAPIAIDRSNPETAIQSIQDGAIRVMNNNRPIVIFPQGTRVKPEQTADVKPYKIGIARIQEATQLPIIPMATNAGLFWPRDSFWKSGGTVVFEFLPPIPAGLERGALLQELENKIEPASNVLMDEAVAKNKQWIKKENRNAVIALVTACVIWLGLWFATQKSFDQLQTRFDNYVSIDTLQTSGFPIFHHVTSSKTTINTPEFNMVATQVDLRMPPLPFALRKTLFTSSLVLVHPIHMQRPIIVRDVKGNIKVNPANVVLENAQFQYGKSIVQTSLSFAPHMVQGVVMFQNANAILKQMVADSLINKKSASFMKAGLMLYKKGDHYIIPITTQDNVIYMGIAPIYRFPTPSQFTSRKKPFSP